MSYTTIATNNLTTDFNTVNSTKANFTFYNHQEDVAKLALRTIFLIIIAALSCVGNLLVCITLYWRPYLLTPSNKLVFSLSTSNFIFSVLVLPFVITSSIAEEWVFGQVWCAMTGFITILVMGASMLTLGAIACDRYYAIVHPMLYPMMITGFRTSVVIVLSWILAGIYALPPLFGTVSRFTFTPDTGGGCMPAWNEGLGYSIFWFLFCFFLPYILMLCCYGCIFQVARNKTRQVRSKSDRKRSSATEYNDMSEGYNTLGREDTQLDLTTLQESDEEKQPDVPEIKVTTTVDLSNNGEEDSGIVLSNETSNFQEPNDSLESSTSSSSSSEENSNGSTEDLSRIPNQVHIENEIKPSRRGSIPTMIIPLSDSRKSSASSGESKTSSDDQYFKDAEANGNRRKSSNASIISQTSHVFRRTSLAFSSVKYYRNQIKAMCTIAFILGILILTMGAFTIITLMEVAKRYQKSKVEMIKDKHSNLESIKPSISSTLLSVATCLMYLTCVYYPLIYGLWNRTVRKEMRCLFCGHQRHPHHEPLRKQRMLSLTTHIQDLGMSPGLTAAIIGEDPVAFKAAVIQDNVARENNLRLSSRWAKPEKDKIMAAIEKRRHTLPVLSMFGSSDAESPADQSGGMKKRQRRFSRFAMNFGPISEEDAEATKNKFLELKMQRNIEKAAAQSLADKTYINTIANGGNSYKMMLKDDITFNHSNNNSPNLADRARDLDNDNAFLRMKAEDFFSREPLNPHLLYAGYKPHKPRRSSLFNFRTPLLQLSPMNNKKNKVGIPKRTLSIGEDEDEDFTKPSSSTVTFKTGDIFEDEKKISPQTPKRTNSKKTSVHFNISVVEHESSLGEIIEEEEEVSSIEEVSSSSEESSIISDNNNKGDKVVTFSDNKTGIMKKDNNATVLDNLSKLTEGRVCQSEVIHLEAGEPIHVSIWSKDQYVDFFASTFVFDVMEYGRCKITEIENPS